MGKFLISAAAVAFAASSAVADPGGGKGGGGGKGNDKAPSTHSQGGGKPDKGPSMKAAKPDRGPSMQAAKAERGNGNGNGKRDNGPLMRAAKADTDRGRGAQKRNDRAVVRDVERRVDRDVRVVRDVRNDRRGDIVRTVSFDDRFDRDFGFVDGCPPGLAKKNNGCMPPGLAKQRDLDWRQSVYQPSWWGYDRLGDGRYYYDDGYLYRLGSNNSILGYVPLLGGALSVGNPWPSYYDPYPVPDYYQDYYNLGSADSYRYADDVLYRVDPQSGMINSIAALLTGDQWAVGQPMPMGYDVYNVPYGYQERYYDTPESMYRYSDGYVYQVDPTTQLVQAVIELLV